MMLEPGAWSQAQVDAHTERAATEPFAWDYCDGALVIPVHFDSESEQIQVRVRGIDGRGGVMPDGSLQKIDGNLTASILGSVCAQLHHHGQVHPMMRAALGVAAQAIGKAAHVVNDSKSDPENQPN